MLASLTDNNIWRILILKDDTICILSIKVCKFWLDPKPDRKKLFHPIIKKSLKVWPK